jgi:phosphomannomutase
MGAKPGITFGTDGWRGQIARDFTFANLELVAQAFADYLREQDISRREIFIGYDRRFLSEHFAVRVAEVLAANEITALVSERDLPTPLVSFQVQQMGLPAGVVITASHNPAHFNGFKIKEAFGGSARSHVTSAIEARLASSSPRRLDREEAEAAGLLRWVAPCDDDYFRRLGTLLDVAAIRRQPWTIIVDPMHGTADRYAERFLRGGRCQVETIRSERDPLFGGVHPEPLPPHLGPLFQAVSERGAVVGLATDGDADRFAAVDEQGEFITPHSLFPLLILHLARIRGERGTVVRTFSQSVLADRIAQALGLPLKIVPIGFKYIADLMLSEDVLIGGEESGGIGVRGYLPERDGILTGLLFLEAIAVSGRPPSEMVRALWREFGEFHYQRRDLPMPVDIGRERVERVTENPPDKLAGQFVTKVETLDGTKLHFRDGSWILFRQSGTEPVLRIYCEAPSREKVHQMLEAGMALCSTKGPA